jgi:hypothetical protein
MELFTKRNLAVAAAGLTAVAVLGACAKGGHAEAAGNQPTAAATAEGAAPATDPSVAASNPNTQPVPTPSESDDGTGGTGDQNQANGGTEGTKKGPKSPLIFVLGDRAGSAILSGCLKDGTTIYTFGTDYTEGKIVGASQTQNGVTKAGPDRTPGELQNFAASHSNELLTGKQKIGGATVDCGGQIDVGNTQFYDESGPVGPDALQAYIPLAKHVDGSGYTVLATAHA